MLATILRRFRHAAPAESSDAIAVQDDTAEEDDFRKLRVGFTAAVSHELRTPLARLLALLDSADLEGADLRDLVARAREEVERMRELVDDVLFLSEVETGREVVSLQGTELLPILEEVASAARERAERAGITFAVVAAPEVVMPLRPRLLRTLVENLVENVFRHARGATRCTLAGRREGGVVLLSVSDNGVGIREDELPRVFERFYRGDTSRSSRGSGLGLAIVKHVVTAAGGDVEARRGPGGLGVEIRCTFRA
jgi:signal transduction histidine kinase